MWTFSPSSAPFHRACSVAQCSTAYLRSAHGFVLPCFRNSLSTAVACRAPCLHLASLADLQRLFICRWRAASICCFNTTRRQWMPAVAAPSSVLRELSFGIETVIVYTTLPCAQVYVSTGRWQAAVHVPYQPFIMACSNAAGTCRTSSSWGHRQWSLPWMCGRNAAVRCCRLQ